MGNAFRLSKCEWQETEFGKAPAHWKIETIGALSEKVTDGSHFSPKPRSVGKYMCSVKDMTYNRFDFSNCKLISQNDFDKLIAQGCKPKKNDILISKDGANCLDLIFLFDQKEDLVLLSSIAIVRLLPNIDPKFVCYFLLSPACQYIMRNNFVSGSAIPRVVLKDFKKVFILLPTFPEQKAIASVLSSLDDKIDLLHRQNKTLEAMAETLFRQWFVEEAQEDWEEKPLSEVVKIAIGRTPPRKEFYWFSTNSTDVKWVSIKDLGQSGIFVFDTSEYLTQEAVETFNIPIIPKDTVLLSFKMTVGRVGITTEPMLSNEAIAHFKFDENTSFSKEYLYIWLKTFKYDSLGSTSSIVTAINSSMIKEIEIVIPDDTTMNNFQAKTEPLFNKIKQNQAQTRTLEKLRNTLLPKLMSGVVRVEF